MRVPNSRGSKFLYLPIEGAARELVPKITLAVAACLRGFTVVIGNKEMVTRVAVENGSGGVYFAKSIVRPSIDGLYGQLRRAGVHIVAQDEEAGIADLRFRTFFNIRPSLKDIPSQDLFFCWGREDYEFLSRELFNGRSNNLALTGATRAAFWGDFGKDFFAEDVKALRLKHPRGFVLFATSFPAGNHVLGRERYLRYVRKNLRYFPGYSPEVSQRIFERDISNMELFVEGIERVLEETDLDVVVRPHPDEDVRFWARAFSGSDRVSVVPEGDATPWLVSTVCLVHHASTLAIQNAGLGGASIALGRIGFNVSGPTLFPNTISTVVHSPSELVTELVKNSGTLRDGVGAQQILNKVKDPGSLENILAIVDELDTVSESSRTGMKISLWTSLRGVLRNIAAVVAPKFGREVLSSRLILGLRKRPLLNDFEVDALVTRNLRLMGARDGQVLHRTLSASVVVLYPSNRKPQS